MSNANTEPEEAALDPTDSPAAGVKRRQSESVEQENKRPRISPGKQSPEKNDDDDVGDSGRANGVNGHEGAEKPAPAADRTAGAEAREARRKSGAVDEKQRSRRLFGSLLGTLGQGGDKTSRRRQEIESRRKAELQRQDDERVEDKQRRVELLTESRRKEQWRVDEEHMRIRHQSRLDVANFLQTESEPKIYYRPWELRPEEEQRIEEQIKETTRQIDQEADEFAQQRPLDEPSERSPPPVDEKPKETSRGRSASMATNEQAAAAGADGASPAGAVDRPGQAKSTPAADHANVADVHASDPTNNDTDCSPSKQHPSETQREGRYGVDQDDGHMVEGEEDTVIY